MFRDRDIHVMERLTGQPLFCKVHAIRLSPKTGLPEHPLYLPGDLRPILYTGRAIERG